MAYAEPIMLTGAILVGFVVLGLVAQVFHAVQIQKAERSMNHKLDELLARIPDPDYQIEGTSASLEDLINLDLMETMGKIAPMTDRQVQELAKEIKDAES